MSCFWQLWRKYPAGCWWLEPMEAVIWGTIVEISLNCFPATCVFHLTDFTLFARFIGTIFLSSSTWSPFPFSFRMYEELWMCSLISVLSHKEVRKHALVPRAICGVSCCASYSTGKRNISQRSMSPGMALRNISVWHTELRHQGTSCVGGAVPCEKRLSSLLADVAIAKQLQVHWNLQNYKRIVNFNEITL